MSQATIISIVPFKIQKSCIGMMPPFLEIDKSENDEVVYKHINDVAYDQYIGEGKVLRIPVVALDFAKQIVNDFRSSVFGADRRRAAFPGIKALDGKVTAIDPKDLKDLRDMQFRWRESLIKKADSDWSRIKNPALISQLQVDAARYLKLNKEWATELKDQVHIDCPACTSRILAKAIICPNCRTILNEAEYKKLSIAVEKK